MHNTVGWWRVLLIVLAIWTGEARSRKTRVHAGRNHTALGTQPRNATETFPVLDLLKQREALAPTRSKLAYVLLGSGTRDEMLTRVLHQMQTRILPWTPGDVLLFHTGEYDSKEQMSMLTAILPDIIVLRIPEESWSLPEGLHAENASSWNYAPCCPFPEHGIGYRHMSRWYSNALFHFLKPRGYEWVIRLDEDSEVLSSVKQDMVEWMQQHGKQYGFRLWDFDDTAIIKSLPELTAWHIMATNLKPKWLYDSCFPRSIAGLNSRGGWNRRTIYNNMFMANITWWLTPEVQAYLNLLEASRGHYLFRWGDAPIHTMVVALFLPRNQVHRFGFSYCHKGSCDNTPRYWEQALRDSKP